MFTNDRADFVRLDELASALLVYADVRAAMEVEFKDGELHVALRIPREQGLGITELGHQLAYLAGIGQVRAFAMHYGINPEALERLLLKETCDGDEERPAR